MLLIFWDYSIKPHLGLTENGPKKGKYTADWQFSGAVHARGQRSKARLFQADSKATISQATQITTSDNQVITKIDSSTT